MVKFLQDTMVDPVDSEVTHTHTHTCSACKQRLTHPLLRLQWFGFLKPGQAKETETLQESLLYKEVTRVKMRNTPACVARRPPFSPFPCVSRTGWAWPPWTKLENWSFWPQPEITSSSPGSGSTRTCCHTCARGPTTPGSH